jgi:hypothetical protein
VDDLSTVLSRAIESKAEYDLRLLAQQLGTNYRSLMYWLRGERHIPAYVLPQLCTLVKNYEGLDFLERQAGRIAFTLPGTKLASDKEVMAVSNLLKEVGDAVESVAGTLADGVVEESELRETVPKLERVIQECASLKYLLEEMCKKGKKSKSGKKT